LNKKYEATVSAHDAKQWASLYAVNATLVPAGSPIVQGRENIEKWGEAAVKVWNTLAISAGPITANGSVAWQVCTWSGNINTPDGKTLDLAGNYLTVLQKEGPAWQIVADTWNINPPKMEEPAVGSTTPPKK
jgi:ketosteroid isomerase-like protein